MPPADQSAVVTLDVLHNGIMWGWLVTMNLWTKSIGTGVLLVGLFLMRRSTSRAFYVLRLPAIAFVSISLTLLFTLADLHQPTRFWHMFVWPHFTSAINLGAWTLNAYMGALTALLFLAWTKRDALYDKVMVPAAVIAFLATIYTAGLLGQANAREVWQAPAEVAQMILSAGIGGSAILLLLGRSLPEEDKTTLGWILALSASVTFVVYLAELVLAPQKSHEAEWVMHELLHGRFSTAFVAGLAFGFVLPATLAFTALKLDRNALLPIASASALGGLWFVKHAWIQVPQLLPLS